MSYQTLNFRIGADLKGEIRANLVTKLSLRQIIKALTNTNTTTQGER